MGEDALTCKTCHEPVAAETVFCPGCGEQLREPPKEKKPGTGGKKGMILALGGGLLAVCFGGLAAAHFGFGLFDEKPPPVKPPPPVSTGPTQADIKKAVDVRAEIGMALRGNRWDVAEQKLELARMLHPDHEDNDDLARRIRVGRAKDLYDNKFTPERRTPAESTINVPECYRAAVKIAGATVALIVQGEETSLMDTVVVAETYTADQRWKKRIALDGEGATLRAISFSFDGDALLLGGTDGKLRIRSVRDGGEIDSVAHPGTVADIAVTRNNERAVVINDDGSVTLFAYKPLRKVETIDAAAGARAVMALDPKNQWVVVGGEKALRVVAFGSRAPDRTIPFEGALLASLAVSPDGTTIAAATADGKVAFFEAQTGKALGDGAVGDRIAQVMFDPSGRMIAVWSDRSGVLKYLTAPELDEVTALDARMVPLTRLAVDANGGSIVVTGKGSEAMTSTYAVFWMKQAD